MAFIQGMLRLKYIIYYTSNKFRTKKEIQNYLMDRDIEISNRTLERDFDEIRDTLNIEFVYKKGLGYKIECLDNDMSDLLDKIELVDLMKKYKVDKEDIIIDNTPKMNKGLENIPLLIDGIVKKMYVQFIYNKHNGEISERDVLPLRLIEYSNMWYLIALTKGSEDIRTFGLDRIFELKITKKLFREKLTKNIENQIANFEKMIGVSMPIVRPEKPVLIELGVSDFLLDYWKSKPLHATQIITSEKRNGFTIVKLFVIPNIDLIKIIISGLGEIHLFGPQSVKDYINEEYKKKISTII